MYRTVVIGCGNIGASNEMDSGLMKPASHAAAFASNPRTTLAGVVDENAAARSRAAAYYTVPAYKDAGAALAELAPDVVVIATPPSSHEALLEAALRSGARAVVCEKPVSDSLESAERMAALAARSPQPVIVNHQRRFMPLFANIRDIVARGELGRVQQVSAYYTNGLFNNGSHSVDSISFLLGESPSWAMGATNDRNKTALFGPNVDGMLGFASGAVATLQSLDASAYGAHEFVLYGTKGAMTIRKWGYEAQIVPVKDGVTFSGVPELDWTGAVTTQDRRSMLADMVEHVADVLDGKTRPQSTLADGVDTMRALDALVRSAAQGSVRIPITYEKA